MNARTSSSVVWVLSVISMAAAQGAVAATPQQAAGGVLLRLLGDRAAAFVLETIPQDRGRDVFEIESVEGKIVVRGSDGVAIASGANWYLRHYCHCQESFCGDQLELPAQLPLPHGKIRRTSPYKYRYCFNFCAFSYTLAWWDWDQWQRMIDWMALHGINMPLSVTGQEAIWQAVYRKLGLTDEEISRFFVGPGVTEHPFWADALFFFVVDDDQSAARAEGSVDRIEHLVRVFEMVVGIADEDQIDRLGRQLG